MLDRRRGALAFLVSALLMLWSGSAAGAGGAVVDLAAICASRDGEQQRLRKTVGSAEAVVRFTVRGQAQDYPLTGNGSFFAKAREVCGVDTYRVKSSALVLSYGAARFGSVYVYSAEGRYIQLVRDEPMECFADWRIHYTPLSLVGTVFSYEEFSDGSNGCGPMSLYNMVAVVDLATGKSARITELVDEVGLIAALKADRFVRERGEDQSESDHTRYLAALDGAHVLDELAGALAMRFMRSSDDVLRHFAFLDYDSKRDLVAVRLVILDDRIPTAERYIQLGVTVAPKKDKRPLFLSAKGGAGFFLGRYPNTLVQGAGKKR